MSKMTDYHPQQDESPRERGRESPRERDYESPREHDESPREHDYESPRDVFTNDHDAVVLVPGPINRNKVAPITRFRDKVSELLRQQGLARYISVFKQHNISEDILHLITEKDLRSMNITAVGDIKRLTSTVVGMPPPEPDEPVVAQPVYSGEDQYSDKGRRASSDQYSDMERRASQKDVSSNNVVTPLTLLALTLLVLTL